MGFPFVKNNHACAKNVNSVCDNKMEAYSILLLFPMFTLIRKSHSIERKYRVPDKEELEIVLGLDMHYLPSTQFLKNRQPE